MVNPESPEAVAARLDLSREALGIKTDKDFFKPVPGMYAQKWSNYKTGELIPVDVARHLYHSYQLSLDWVYLGVKTGLPYLLARKIEALEALQSHSKPRRASKRS